MFTVVLYCIIFKNLCTSIDYFNLSQLITVVISTKLMLIYIYNFISDSDAQ